MNCIRGLKLYFFSYAFIVGLFAIILMCLMTGPCLAQSSKTDTTAGTGENLSELLAPLQALHDDLSRIEAKLDGLANAKWEYKILTPNILGKSKLDPYEPDLAPYGKDGWELVTYSPDVGYILKRRVAPDSK
ncbi:hypothetical protein [Desulfovibrio sp. JC022]|uniref:hypothetical protein n=1 Tax=Desulfovibrio sp. JC022 TaxID=2593642 RepID=UPI0013D45C46|nr:hypothetical protein [Desulfovibrio sp. JC022]NDV22268.1 hypothetical protein [Desulfovibrio sp. JC022]